MSKFKVGDICHTEKRDDWTDDCSDVDVTISKVPDEDRRIGGELYYVVTLPDGKPACYLESELTLASMAEPEGAVKHDADKPDPTLVPPKAVLAIARAMGFGAKKYGRDNYRQAPRLERNRLLASAFRHLLADLDGEALDPESGLPHVNHAMASLAMLIDGEDA